MLACDGHYGVEFIRIFLELLYQRSHLYGFGTSPKNKHNGFHYITSLKFTGVEQPCIFEIRNYSTYAGGLSHKSPEPFTSHALYELRGTFEISDIEVKTATKSLVNSPVYLFDLLHQQFLLWRAHGYEYKVRFFNFIFSITFDSFTLCIP